MLALFVVHDVPVTATPLEHEHVFVTRIQRQDVEEEQDFLEEDFVL